MDKVTAILLVFVLAASQVVTFTPVKAEPKTIIVPDDYPTIEEAIDHANSGDTVFVKEGIYYVYGFQRHNARLLVNKSISLKGENSIRTRILPDPESSRHYSTSLVGVSADKVAISGFTISGEQTSLGVSGSWCTVMGNTLGHDLGGITALSVSGSRCTIIGNSAIGEVNIGGENNILSQNSIQGNRLYVGGSNHLIEGNNVTGSPGEGIALECHNVIVRDNNITNNGLNYGTIGRDMWHAGGIYLNNGPNYIYRNNIRDNVHFGIGLNPGSDAIVFNNNIFGNDIGIRLVLLNRTDIKVANKVYYNNLMDNGENVAIEQIVVGDYFVSGFDGADAVAWDNGVVGNYWSDYNGQGKYVIDENNVDYHPLTQQVDISTTAPKPEDSAILLMIAIVAVVVACAGLVFYFKKNHKRQAEQ